MVYFVLEFKIVELLVSVILFNYSSIPLPVFAQHLLQNSFYFRQAVGLYNIGRSAGFKSCPDAFSITATGIHNNWQVGKGWIGPKRFNRFLT